MNPVSVRGWLFALAMLASPAVASPDQKLAHIAFKDGLTQDDPARRDGRLDCYCA